MTGTIFYTTITKDKKSGEIKENTEKSHDAHDANDTIQPHDELVFPDAHGNALATINKLRKHGVMELKDAQFDQLAKIFHKKIKDPKSQETKDDCLTSEDINTFQEILEKATYHQDKYKLIRFLGDMLADRQGNDLFTLMLLQVLHDKKINYKINISNHDLEFLRYRYLLMSFKLGKDYSPDIIGEEQTGTQTQSLDNFRKTLSFSLIPDNIKRDILKRFSHYYLHHLSLGEITFDEEEFCNSNSGLPQAIVYRHAPCGTEVMEPLYKSLVDKKGTCAIDNVIDLIDTQDEIEMSFRSRLIPDWNESIENKKNKDKKNDKKPHAKKSFIQNLWRDFFSQPLMTRTDDAYTSMEEITSKHPIDYICWNRDTNKIRGSKYYHLTVVHGHTGNDINSSEDLPGKNIRLLNLDFNNRFIPKKKTCIEDKYVTYISPSYIPSFKKLSRALQKIKPKKDDQPNLLYNAGLAFHNSSKELLKFCLKNNFREQYKIVKEAVIVAAKAIDDPKNVNIKQLHESIQAINNLQMPNPPPSKIARTIKIAVGALLLIAGACLMVASFYAAPFTLGASLLLAAKIVGPIFAFVGAVLLKDSYNDYKYTKVANSFFTIKDAVNDQNNRLIAEITAKKEHK